MAKSKKLPDMSDWTAKEVHEFWKTHSSADYWDQTNEAMRLSIPSDANVLTCPC